ncbi:hypothetical protein CROQUDRAFT_654438 [Cronartium quercuum f. sp. fusiforme G11]|uniref:GIT Spa2 homology (SHD) domain-containing protein n=1 Tax=Cronartium quercuum f. sp. fusiforme G11 TaxID=708437 RepID=A0A9P6NSN6_9BASI|nr:hypothetical protein CROQUDRAFT_654438 [Cronartium quercuum f. sp. fusiforme G11]
MSRYPPPTPQSQYDNQSIGLSSYQRSDTRPSPSSRSQQNPNGHPSKTSNFSSSSNATGPNELEQSRRTARIHYDELNQWLYKGIGSNAKNSQNRLNPRDKLTRLTRQQFQELSTDVYDELCRRIERGEQDGGEPKGGSPFLISRDDFHPKRNQARQKLATLPRSRFKDLASDVFYELERRYPEFSESETPSSRPNNSNPITKSSTPEHLSRGNNSSFPSSNPPLRPLLTGGSGGSGSGGGILANDVIVPDKSTLVLDPTDGFPFEDTPAPSALPAQLTKSTRSSSDRDRDRGSETASTERSDYFDRGNSLKRRSGSLSSLKYISQKNPPAGSEVRSPVKDRSGSIRSNYERRISLMQIKIKNLEQELVQTQRLNEMRAEDSERIRELEDELTSWKERCARQREELKDLEETVEAQRNANSREMQLANEEISRLNQQISDLEHEQRQQLQAKITAKSSTSTSEAIVERLKGEVTDLLNELRQLQTKQDELVMEREADQETIRELEEDVIFNKKRYEAAKTELRNLKRTSALHAAQNFIPNERFPITDNGAIADIHFTAFTLSIDELLQAGRSNGNNEVINAMRTVISAVGAIDEDVQEFEEVNAHPLSLEDREKLDGLKARINATLSNLITAAKNHVVSMGLSPISLLDAASSHLSFSMIELVKLVGMRKADAMEVERYETMHSNGRHSDDEEEGGLVLSTSKNSYSHRAHGRTGPTSSIPVLKALQDRKTEETTKVVPVSSKTPTPLALKALGIRPDYTSGANHNTRQPVTPPKSPFSKPRELLLQQRNFDDVSGSGLRKASGSLTRGNQKYEAMRSPSGFDGSNESDIRDSVSGSSTTNPDKVFDSPPRRGDPEQRKAKNAIVGSGSGLNSVVTRNGGFEESPARKMTNFGLGISRAEDEERDKLRAYLETQTESIVAYIQALLSAIRGGGGGGALSENLTQIITIVSSIVAMTGDCITATKQPETERILSDLSQNCDRLSEMQDMDSSKAGFTKQTKQAMAAASFGVAKALKELNSYIAGDHLSIL